MKQIGKQAYQQFFSSSGHWQAKDAGVLLAIGCDFSEAGGLQAKREHYNAAMLFFVGPGVNRFLKFPVREPRTCSKTSHAQCIRYCAKLQATV